MVLHVSGRQAGASQQCRITRQQYGSKLEAAGIQATLYVMMCTVKNTPFIYLFIFDTPPFCFIDSAHLFGPFIDFLFSYPGMPYDLLASVSVHAWVACLLILPRFFFCESQRSPVCWSCYMTNIHFYLQTSMTLLIPPLIPPPLVACLCLSSNHNPSSFSFSSSPLRQGGSTMTFR